MEEYKQADKGEPPNGEVRGRGLDRVLSREKNHSLGPKCYCQKRVWHYYRPVKCAFSIQLFPKRLLLTSYTDDF
jgi:hypothetical protein